MTDNLHASSRRWVTNFYEDDTSSESDRRCSLHSRVADELHRASFIGLPGCDIQQKENEIKLIGDESAELSLDILRLDSLSRPSELGRTNDPKSLIDLLSSDV